MREAILTNSLAGLIRLAVDDARALDRTVFSPHFGYWLSKPESQKVLIGRDDPDVCLFCLAGAMIARRFEYDDLRDSVYPADEVFSFEEKRALAAVDHARCGKYDVAYGELGRPYMIKKAGQAMHLGDLKPPKYQYFKGWYQFSKHLVSLEVVAYKLEEMEKQNRIELFGEGG